ncbi:MAG: hypothetical protein IKB07_08955 [Lachnospiraceae bacterium]|nr:hypothetical protein [Lachnospiraceae bacterium]
MNRPIHILRYGTVAENVHLGRAISAYDYLGINGNSAAFVSTAIANFIVEKFFSKPEKGFFIDPITYAFQNEIRLLKSKSKATGEEKIKKSVEKLIEIYGEPLEKVRTGVPVSADDFLKVADREAFLDRVLSFQYNLVYQHMEEHDLKKYLDYVTVDNMPQLRPKFLIAPYFYLDAQDVSFDKWLEINTSFANMAVSRSENKFNNIDVFAQIIINKNVLFDAEKMQRIVECYRGLPCAGYTVWVDGLNEHEASFAELRGFMDLLRGLHGKPIYNMYGGYFSILLTHKTLGLLNGVSHGLEYGESRKVYPVGGGIPVSKYYYYPIHQRVDFTKAFYMLEHIGVIDTREEDWGSSERYYAEICKCECCEHILGTNMINFMQFESTEFYEVKRKKQMLRRKKASPNTKQNCLYHYLLCKKVEFYRAGKNSLDVLLSELVEQRGKYEGSGAIRESEMEYLDVWVRCLSE